MVNYRIFDKYELGKVLIPVKLFPTGFKFKQEFETLYEKSYFNNLNYYLITNLFFASLLLNLVLYVTFYPNLISFLKLLFAESILLQFQSTFIFITWFLSSLYIYYAVLFSFFFLIQAKFREAEAEIERNLPEFIDNLVSNLKGGISLEKALIKSVRVEQKALVREVTLINEKVMMGASVISALVGFRDRFNSPIIKRTIFLIEEGLKGGGNLSKPLERISENLKRIYALNEEVKANSAGTAIVIKIISLVLAPLLFALAITLITFISRIFSLLDGSGGDFVSVAQIPQTFIEYLSTFSLFMIVLITVFSSLIISGLNNEKNYESLRFLPFYIFLSTLIFKFISDFLIEFFSNIL